MRLEPATVRRWLRAGLTVLLATIACRAAGAEPAPTPRDTGGPVIGCTSLANLRTVLRQSEGNPVAALAIATNPSSDLGCAVVDPATVTAIAEHIALHRNAYDCLTRKGTGLCHWVVAGTVAPAASPPAEAGRAPPARKPKR